MLEDLGQGYTAKLGISLAAATAPIELKFVTLGLVAARLRCIYGHSAASCSGIGMSQS